MMEIQKDPEQDNATIKLKYGCNPNQTPAHIFKRHGNLPIEILNGKVGYINLLDALNAWQLVKELKEITGFAAAASFKHVSPAGAAIAIPLDHTAKQMYFAQEDIYSDIATAYIRARGADRVSSYGDFVALSDECDEQTARYICNESSDGIIAPSYSDTALKILKEYRKGKYIVICIDVKYEPPKTEIRDVYGITFEQARNDVKITSQTLNNIVTHNKNIPSESALDLLVAQITLKYTQSNSICYAKNGQTIGIGAGQQSRIHCTRLAGEKADIWRLRSYPKILSLPFISNIKRYDRDNVIDAVIRCDDYIYNEWQRFLHEKPFVMSDAEKCNWIKDFTDVSFSSDAYIPFGDNIERAYKSGVRFIAQSGGSIRDSNVIELCDKYGIAMAFTGIRLFHH